MKRLRSSSQTAASGKTPAIAYDARSFLIHGQRVFLIGGEFHYFRVPHQLWPDRLLKMKRAGANFVTTYIPWNWHEPQEGKFLWEGDRDLERFIRLCRDLDLYLVVKPGPYICAEWDLGGYPDWILAKHIPLRVLDERHLRYVRRWYKQVAERIVPYLITNGGNIIAIQVENEYDHLMRLGDEKISLEEAIEYFQRLAGFMDELGLDVPKFANEAEFLQGSGIIDTRTYYPNIPWIWMWEFGYFDRKILNARRGQPDCPTMILELQSGWFSQFGQPYYIPPVEVTESVSKSVLMLGASFLNYYMFVGGTTFPFWGCRGDCSAHPPGQLESVSRPIGTTTSYDFGGSPVREWGQTMPGRYDFIRAFSRFTRDFGGFIFDSELSEEVGVDAGAEVALLGSDGVSPDRERRSPAENFTVMVRKKGNQHLVGVRNLSAYPQRVRLFWKRSGRTIFEAVELRPRETRLLPVNIQIPGSRIRIVRSSSELLFATRRNGTVVFGLYGKPGREYETVLNVPARMVRVLAGDVHVSGSEQAVLRYRHDGLQVVSVQGQILLLLDSHLAGKLEVTEQGVLVADAAFVRQLEESPGRLDITLEAEQPSPATLYFISPMRPRRVAVAGRKPAEVQRRRGYASVRLPVRRSPAVTLDWIGPWKARTDWQEADPAYDDSGWRTLKLPSTLEDAGLLEHGYVWYRATLTVEKPPSEARLLFRGNDIDHQYVFVNGTPVWDGIASEVEIDLPKGLLRKRNCLAVLYRNFFHNKAHPSEGPILKYSGIRGMAIAGPDGSRGRSAVVRTVRVREGLGGLRAGYHQPEHDDSGWITVPEESRRLATEPGTLITWLRRRFRCRFSPAHRAAVRLTIPAGAERCLIYLNGRAVGHYEAVGPQREFYLPEPLLREENLLAIVLEGPRSWIELPRLDTYFEHRVLQVSAVLR